jgi:hypothetical protein
MRHMHVFNRTLLLGDPLDVMCCLRFPLESPILHRISAFSFSVSPSLYPRKYGHQKAVRSLLEKVMRTPGGWVGYEKG